MKQYFFILLSLILLFSACSKDDVDYNSNVKAKVVIEYDNVVGNQNLQLGSTDYTNATGETFKVTLFKYFVSNFKLTKADGSEYVVPQDSCYFLTDESIASSLKPVIQVPEGEYTQLSFVLGVDSLRNTMDVSHRTGNLDVTGTASGMYWSWNSGYIFYKLEGTSPASAATGNAFRYHIGLFGGMNSATLNNIKVINIDLTSKGKLKAKYGRNLSIKLKADALKLFNGSSNISIAANTVVMASPFSATVANNYATMFTHDATTN
ncbi:MAG: MbnP family protein [Niabella sp.]